MLLMCTSMGRILSSTINSFKFISLNWCDVRVCIYNCHGILLNGYRLTAYMHITLYNTECELVLQMLPYSAVSYKLFFLVHEKKGRICMVQTSWNVTMLLYILPYSHKCQAYTDQDNGCRLHAYGRTLTFTLNHKLKYTMSYKSQSDFTNAI